MKKLTGSAAGEYKLKSCGKRHAHCKVCRFDIYEKYDFKWLHTDEARKKISNTFIKKGLSAGKNNPNWRGGVNSRSLVGWKKIRQEVRNRDMYCRVCLFPPEKNRKMDVHHIKSKREGGKDTLGNLVAVHRSCHIKLEYGKVKITY